MTADELQRQYDAGEREFRGVILEDAQIAGADLTGICLAGAELGLSNFARAKFLRAGESKVRMARHTSPKPAFLIFQMTYPW